MSIFNKKVGKDIPKDQADKLTNNWKKTKPKTFSSFFGTDHIQRLLDMRNCVGIRIHYGLDDQGNMQPVITAEIVDSADAEKAQTSTDGPYVDSSLGCPPYC